MSGVVPATYGASYGTSMPTYGASFRVHQRSNEWSCPRDLRCVLRDVDAHLWCVLRDGDAHLRCVLRDVDAHLRWLRRWLQLHADDQRLWHAVLRCAGRWIFRRAVDADLLGPCRGPDERRCPDDLRGPDDLR